MTIAHALHPSLCALPAAVHCRTVPQCLLRHLTFHYHIITPQLHRLQHRQLCVQKNEAEEKNLPIECRYLALIFLITHLAGVANVTWLFTPLGMPEWRMPTILPMPLKMSKPESPLQRNHRTACCSCTVLESTVSGDKNELASCASTLKLVVDGGEMVVVPW